MGAPVPCTTRLAQCDTLKPAWISYRHRSDLFASPPNITVSWSPDLLYSQNSSEHSLFRQHNVFSVFYLARCARSQSLLGSIVSIPHNRHPNTLGYVLSAVHLLYDRRLNSCSRLCSLFWYCVRTMDFHEYSNSFEPLLFLSALYFQPSDHNGRPGRAICWKYVLMTMKYSSAIAVIHVDT